MIALGVHELGLAVVVLNFTVPWLAPKLYPLMVTTVPFEPVTGLRLVIVGAVPVMMVPILNAANPTPQSPLALSVAVAAALPACASLWSSATN